VTEDSSGLPDGIVGSTVAGYRIESRIGHGGMAAVYQAYDSRLERVVALKLLSPALASDEAFRQRFIRESRAAAAVDHPHIIPVFEAGEADGIGFIAMRYVRGGDVRSLIGRTGPLPAARAAEIIAQVASALDAAHARGLVHRDVKPANMLLDGGHSGRSDHVYLSDFGLSKSVAITSLTAAGQLVGTLDYVSPEQIEGRTVDGRADQYALACTAFELLCGEPPFHRHDGVAVMYAQLSESPPLVRRRRPELPNEVDDVVGKALAKAAEDRYATCTEFATALREALGLGSGDAGPWEDVVPPAADLGALAEQDRATMPARSGLTRTSSPSARTPTTDRVWREPVPPGLPGRPWWRSRAAAAGLAAILVVAAGGAYAVASRGHGGNGGHAGHRTTRQTLAVAACSTAIGSATTLSEVTTASVGLDGSPWGVATTPDGRYTFVSVGNAVDVLGNTAGLAPKLLRTIPAPGAGRGLTLTPDGRFVLAAAGSGVVVINVARAEQGVGNPIVGTLTSRRGAGAAEVQISADDQFAFVTLQNSAAMAVFRLGLALSHGFSPADFVGDVPLGTQPVGLASNGTWIYAASLAGTVSIVSAARAETRPRDAVVATIPVGCGADRVLLGRHEQDLWVTVRGADEVLAFNAARLLTDRRRALIATIKVGEVPLSEIFVDGGRLMVIADSNLAGLASASSNLAVVNVQAALAHESALVGYVPTGLVPRELAIEHGGKTLLVTDEKSHQLQAFKVADLP
jgi:DNA-binding beta-propeller fold protein YncE